LSRLAIPTAESLVGSAALIPRLPRFGASRGGSRGRQNRKLAAVVNPMLQINSWAVCLAGGVTF
jgi:hypothetical protein